MPHPVDSWDVELDLASKYPPLCIQAWREDGGTNWEPGSSEDCLYLNIWAPKDAVENPDAKLPVQVFFHGGSYFFGKLNPEQHRILYKYFFRFE